MTYLKKTKSQSNSLIFTNSTKTKKAAVTQALQEYIQKRQQLKALELFGTIDYDPSYDYKAQRSFGAAVGTI